MAAGANIKGITIEIGGETTKLDKALSGVERTSKTLQNQLKAVNQALKLDPKNVDLLKEKQEILSKSIEATKEKLQMLKTAQEQAAAAFARGEIDENQYRALQTEITKTETELKRLEDEAKNLNPTLQSIGQTVQDVGEKFSKAGDLITKVGDGMQSAGKALMPVTTAITGIGTASVAAAMSFEDAIAKLSTIADTSEETGVPLNDLQDQIMELSDQTGISASEIANNVYDAISAGQKTGDAVNFVSNATALAKAGFTDSGAALDILTTALNAYGLEADQVRHVSDVLINTQNLGKTTVDQLAASMGKVIPTAKANGVSIENLAGMYAVMTSNGIATAETTTYMNSMLNELGKQGTAAANAFATGTEHIKEGGLTMAEAMEQGWSLTDVLSILDEQAYISGTTIGNMFGSAEAGKAATVLWDNAKKLDEAVEQMGNSAGATDEAFAKLDTTSNQAKIALNEVKNAGIDLGQTILQMVMPYFQQFTQKIKDVTTWFKNLDDSQKQMIVRIAAIVAAVAPALMIGGKVISTVGKVTSGIGGIITKVGGLISKMGGLSGALSAIASPVGIVIAAIAALAAGFVYLYKTNDEFREKVNASIEKVKKTFSEMVEKIEPLLEKLKEAFKKLMTALQPIFEFILTYIMAIVNGIINAAAPIIAAITNVVEFVTNIISAVFALLSRDFDGFFSYIGSALQNAADFMKNIISAWVNFIVGFFEGFGVDIKKIFSDIWFGIVSIFQGVGQWFSDRFTEAYTAVTTVFSGIGQWFSARWTDIKNALSTVGTWFLTMFQTAYTNVTNVFKAIGQWFGARWTDIKNALSTVADWFRQKFHAAYDNVTSVFKNIGSWFQTNVIDKIKSVFDSFSLLDAGKKMINSLVEGIKSIKLPKLSITWGSESKEGDGGSKISIPVPHISWNAIGGIMKNPTIFGMYGGKLQGGGEAGDEAILPLDIFYKRTESYIDDAIARATAAAKAADSGSRGNGGFVQNINIESPEPLSPYEVARQTRNQTRNLVLQLQRG